jgi:hypothetical protein
MMKMSTILTANLDTDFRPTSTVYKYLDGCLYLFLFCCYQHLPGIAKQQVLSLQHTATTIALGCLVT